MGEASSLPPGDPVRVEMQDEVARLGAWAEREWLALLEEGERWRLALSRVEIPEGLPDRLLAIPAQRRARTSRLVVRGARALALAAATLLLVLAGYALLRPSPARSDPLESLARLAIRDHLETHVLDVRSGDPEAVRDALGPRVPFPVRFPPLGASLQIVGGRRCTLETHPVAFSTWTHGPSRLTLLQIQGQEFGLPPRVEPIVVHPRGAAAEGPALHVRIWTDAGFAYVLVSDDPALLESIR